MDARTLIKNVLYEKKEKALTIFYKTDIEIKENPEEMEEPAEVPTEAPKEEVPVPETLTQQEETIFEETFTSKSEGKTVVSENEIDNIQSLEDLMDYLSNKKIRGTPILNDAITEIIMNMANGGAQSIADLVDKSDKILINIDYGKDKDNSIGIKALKNKGTNILSLVMKKNDKVIPGTFNLQEFNRQIVFFRNSIIGE